MMEGKSQNIEKPVKQYKVFVAFKVALVLLVLDAFVNSLLSAYSLGLPREYAGETNSFYFLRFLQNLGFGTFIYINHVILIYVILALIFIFISRFIKDKKNHYIITGVILSFVCYFFYAYNWSVNHIRDHFSYSVIWYIILGGMFGWIYFKIYFATSNQQ